MRDGKRGDAVRRRGIREGEKGTTEHCKTSQQIPGGADGAIRAVQGGPQPGERAGRYAGALQGGRRA